MSNKTKSPETQKVNEPWYAKGIQFECQQSGKCCTSHGEFGFVYLTRKDRERMAKHFGLRPAEFTQKYCGMTDGIYHLKEEPKNPDCIFLKGKSCGVYEARPTQCRTWPFWPDIMNAKTWNKEVASFCPGVGKGRVFSREEIEAQLNEQKKSDSQLGS